jgi:hypothetical protein
MIQATTEIDAGQVIPVISYFRRRLCTLREDTVQYDRYVLHPAKKLQKSEYPNCIQRRQTSWTQESFESRFGRFCSETLPGVVRAGTP